MDQHVLRVQVIDFLERHRKAVLGICMDECTPTTSPIYYAVNETFEIHFGTRRVFTKYNNLKRHPNVSLTIVQDASDPLQSVEVRGVAHEIEAEHIPATFEWFAKSNPNHHHLNDADDFVMFKVIPRCVRWFDASTGEFTITHIDL